jgi:hypothetical protein
MGQDLRNQILIRDGIQPERSSDKKPVTICQNCNTINAREYDNCINCQFPMTPKAVEAVRTKDQQHLNRIVEDHKHEMQLLETKLKMEMHEQVKQASEQAIIEFLNKEPTFVKALMDRSKRRAREGSVAPKVGEMV